MFIPHTEYEHCREWKKKTLNPHQNITLKPVEIKFLVTLTLAFFPEGKETVATAGRESSAKGCQKQSPQRDSAWWAHFLAHSFLASVTNFLGCTGSFWPPSKGESTATPLIELQTSLLAAFPFPWLLPTETWDWFYLPSFRQTFYRQTVAALNQLCCCIWSQDRDAIV